MGLTLLFVLAGAALAFVRYWRAEVPVVAPHGSFATRAARKDLFQDDVNDLLAIGPVMGLAGATRATDRALGDGGADGIGRLVTGAASGLRRAQNGFVRSYALTMLVGVVAVLASLWVMN